MTTAILVIDSQNTKIGRRVAATYASIRASCPESCPLRDRGCYAQDGHVAFTVRRLDARARGALRAALDEVAAIDGVDVPDGRPMRLHVSGDSRTEDSARLVSNAAARWRQRGGGPVWSYTHAWGTVRRSAWHDAVSILGSVDHLAQGRSALAAGYAPAAVTGPHAADGRAFDHEGVRWIPCPNQTRGITCEECRLCWNAEALHARGAGIAFEAHGRPRAVLQLPLLR